MPNETTQRPMPTDSEIQEASKKEFKNLNSLPFYHKDNVNIDLCRRMFVEGALWFKSKIQQS